MTGSTGRASGEQPALARQLAMARAQVQRSQLPVAVAHTFVAWILWRDGMPGYAATWLAAITLLNAGRSWHMHRLRIDCQQDAERTGRVVLTWLVALGLLRPVPILLTALSPSIDGHYMITMVMLGLTVGGVSNLAGLLRLYDAWSGPLFLTMCGIWLWRGAVEGIAVAVLLLLMFVLLRSYVRDYGLVLSREMDLVAELRIEQDRTQAAIVAKSRFFAAASHDLRQPLAALRWYGEAVLEHARLLNHEGLEQIGHGIGRAVARTDPLLEQYLEISRLETREAPLQKKPVDLRALLLQTAEYWQPEALRRGLELSVQGEIECKPVAQGNEQSLRRILDNLVTNALKFTPSGGVTLAVSRAMETPKLWRLSVTDTGIGIDNTYHAQIFEDFFQVGNSARSADKGVGLGLSIARRHAELLDATLRLRSVPGLGTCFEIDLPAIDSEPAPQDTTVLASPQLIQRHLRLLIVDDDSDVRQALKTRLESRGWTAVTTCGHSGALAEWHSGFIPDVVIVDHSLEDGQTGLDLVMALRHIGCKAPAVIITGGTTDDCLAHLSSSGLPVLQKPVSDTVLLQTLARLVA